MKMDCHTRNKTLHFSGMPLITNAQKMQHYVICDLLFYVELLIIEIHAEILVLAHEKNFCWQLCALVAKYIYFLYTMCPGM